MISPTDNCYGCRACEQICAHNAIKMQPNDEGFLFPVVDTEKCIDCGLCDKVCSENIENVDKILHANSSDVYAAWSKSEQKNIESTSGGAFAMIAEHVLANKGVVYGCAWKDEELVAFHKRITTILELNRLKGSKYVQSDVEDTFSQVKKDLKSGLQVLYSGTPCQIAGLRLFLRKESDNLLTIDLVCHGVPSPMMFKSYIDWLELKQKAKISEYKFRDLKSSGYSAHNSWIENNKKKTMSLCSLQPYFCGFNDSYFNRESCFKCVFSQSRRVGDITLSDFWGGEKYHKELISARRLGYNLVICNNRKAQTIFESIVDKINILPSKLEYAIEGDIRLRESDPRPSFRDKSYVILKDKGFDYLQKNHLRSKYYYIQKMIPTWLRVLINKVRRK